MSAPVTAIVVSYADPDAAREAVRSLAGQTTPPRRVLVVDNHELALYGESRDGEEVMRLGGNAGYTRAGNAAAARTTDEWLLFLNPDAIAEPDALERLVEAGRDGAAVVGAQVLLADGRAVNAGDNPVHLSGLCWSGRFGEPAESGPPRETAAVSGAAMLVRREAFERVGGMCERFFLYYDDADLCWRIRLGGGRVVFCPTARVRHDYDFDQGPRKWFWLERNRLWAVLANYSGRSLVVLTPLLVATELATAAFALREGWVREKAAAWRDVLAHLNELRAWRRRVQALRRLPDRKVVAAFTPAFDSVLVDTTLRGPVNRAMSAYNAVARLLL